MRIDAAAIDEIAATWFGAHRGQPGLAYGIVADGELIHARGLGEARVGGPAPDADTVFRIASMTKSFTAATVLTLRDAGLLALDAPASHFVPELAGLRLPAADCPPVTVRNLLTMTAGFATDDPWGDRQQGLDPAEFGQMLSDGEVRCAWAPGTRFEYSNLGYATLGRVIESVAGQSYAQAVRTRLLAPLGLQRTGYEASEFDPAQLAGGYRRHRETWLELPPDAHGAFAPMGGVFSCVSDLAKWVAGFVSAFPSRDGAEGGHPLPRASRREMQLAQIAVPAGGDGTVIRFGGEPRQSYGFGLFCDDHPIFGDVIHHSGGYPGFGSNMRWHPATGIGVIVLANGTYAGAWALSSELHAALLAEAATTERAAPGCLMTGPVPERAGPWPETLAARDSVNALLQDWDDQSARNLFAANVGLDQPIAERRADIATLRERIGPFARNEARPAECDTPASCRWWLTGPGGTVAVQIQLAPLRRPLVQQLSLAIPPDPESTLARALGLLTGALAAGAADWPAELTVGGRLQKQELLRQLRMAAAWAGRCELDSYLAGDGKSSTTARLTGADGRIDLALEVGESGQLVRCAIALAVTPDRDLPGEQALALPAAGDNS
jgi:CubicO group peptidase (beta-lactamase class C family)